MERNWTDLRDGTRWTVRRAGATGTRGAAPAASDGREGDTPALVFTRGERRLSVPTDHADGLDGLDDRQLQALLDRAREAPGGPDEDLRDAEGSGGTDAPARRGEGPASPDAMGRESQPHLDPRRRGVESG